MAMNSSNSSFLMVVFATQTIPTTETTVWSVKKVSVVFSPLADTSLMRMSTVWIGPLVIKELKRIVEASEITKYVSYD